MDKLEYYEILKTNINVTNMEDTLNYIGNNLDKLRGKYICVSNVHTTVMSYESEDYRGIQNNAAMALPDGYPLSKYCRINGVKHAMRVTGPDLMLEMFKISPRNGYRHFFYGSTQENLDIMRDKLEKTYPGIQIAGMYSPPYRPLTTNEDEEAVRMINDAEPDIIWVGLGAPKQEIWMSKHCGRVNGLMIGVGAGFDFFSGNVKRAPLIVQKLGLEWLHRLLQDPKRLWKRYVTTNYKFVKYILREKRRKNAQ
jgi:N-acetylglucosaminyldiphosphoundecaprenol N-acetyl-beta-D-mannosaminyltransferase